MGRSPGVIFRAYDVLALGDAENDLALFEASGWSGCPASAMPEVRRHVDWSFPGEDGEAIAQAIVGPVLHGWLPLDRSARQRTDVGWAAGTAEAVTIPARSVNVLIHGDPASGNRGSRARSSSAFASGATRCASSTSRGTMPRWRGSPG